MDSYWTILAESYWTDVVQLLYDEGMANSELITCTADKCNASFFLVPARKFPTLCLDHADDASRSAHGWTIANSVD